MVALASRLENFELNDDSTLLKMLESAELSDEALSVDGAVAVALELSVELVMGTMAEPVAPELEKADAG